MAALIQVKSQILKKSIIGRTLMDLRMSVHRSNRETFIISLPLHCIDNLWIVKSLAQRLWLITLWSRVFRTQADVTKG